MSQEYNATLLRRIEITNELLILHVAIDGGLAPFQSGQYTTLGLLGSAPRRDLSEPDREPVDPDKMLKRAYSIGSSPDEKEFLELYVAIVPDGALSARLAVLKPGDRLFLGKKITGTFTLESVPPNTNLVLVSTGTGIAPFVSMIRTKEVWSSGRSITLLHGVRYAKDLAYREELEALVAAGAPLKYIPVVSRESWAGPTGRVTDALRQLTLDPARDHVFLCGNPAMIDEVEGSLKAKGYIEHSRRTPGSLHLERYW